MYAGPDTLKKDRGFQSGSVAVRVWSIVSPARPPIGDGWSRTGDPLGVTGITRVKEFEKTAWGVRMRTRPESCDSRVAEAGSFGEGKREPALSGVPSVLVGLI